MNINKKKEIVYLAILLILITLFSCYYINRKSGFYVDEGMTLYLSNGTYTGAVTTVPEATIFDFMDEYVLKDTVSGTISNVRGMLEDVMGAGDYSVKGTVEWYDAARSVLQGRNTWMSGAQLYDMITASKEKRFDYAQVYINQMMDVHPCVYYFVVHTVFSLFPGAYSPYFLFGINILCLLITCVLMYKMCRKIGLDMAVSLFCIAIFGFSQGFVSCAVFFRMYAMETLFVFMTFYYYMTLKDKEYELERRDYIILGLIEILGFNVHYYYIIYLFTLFAVTLITMIRRKKKVKKFVIAQVVTGVISLVMWPFSLYHILFGYRGTEAFSRLTSFGLIKSIMDYLRLCADSLMFGPVAIAGILLAGTGVYVCAKFRITGSEGKFGDEGKADHDNKFGRQAVPWMELVIPVIVYLVLVSKVAPSDSARYVMCLFPFIVVYIAVGFSKVLEHLGTKDIRKGYLCIVLAALYAICTVAFKQPDYLYPEMDKELGAAIDRSRTNCLMIASEHYKGFPYLIKLTGFDRVMVVDAPLLDTIKETRPDDEQEDMIVYIDNTLDRNEILKGLDEYGYLAGREAEETDSDLPDFSAMHLGVR